MNNVNEIINSIFKNVFGKENQYTLDEIFEKFAFDIKLPQKVCDSITGEDTWATSVNSHKYITNASSEMVEKEKGWMREKKDINSLDEIINAWNEINYMTTERVYDSINVLESDTIYACENALRCSDCGDSKNIIFCDSCYHVENLLASQRSNTCAYCIRCDDSKNCSNSYNVICSNKIINSLFISDASNLDECIFCSHISNKKYCIANMQFSEEEYYAIKRSIIAWILNS